MNLVPNPLSIAITSALFTFSAQSFSEESTQVNKELVSDLEIITVTGDFRQNNLQKIPSSLSVLNADDIKTRNAQNLEEISKECGNNINKIYR